MAGRQRKPSLQQTDVLQSRRYNMLEEFPLSNPRQLCWDQKYRLRPPINEQRKHKDKINGEHHMKMTNLEDVFTDESKDIYSAENQTIKALPKMTKVSNGELPSALSRCARN